MNRTLAIILANGAILRIAAIDQPLWYDESYTAMLVRLPINRMIQATLGDVHPPTWYLIERAFSALFGSGEIALRLPSMLLGLAAIYLTWRFTHTLIGERAALVAAGIVAFSPFEVYYSNEARMYVLLTCAVLVACIGLVERRAWLLGAGVAVTLLSHNMAVIYLPAFLVLALRRFGLRKSFITMGVGSSAWAAWLPTLVIQARRIGPGAGGYWIADITGNTFVSLAANLNQMIFPSFTPNWLTPSCVLVSSGLVIFPLVEAIRRRNQNALTMAALAFGPSMVSLGISLAWQPMILSRTLAGGLPAWSGLIAWWIMLPRKWDPPRIILIGMIGITCLVPLANYYHQYDRSDGMRKAANWLSAHAQPNDIICHADNSSIVLLSYYFHGNVAVIDFPSQLRNSLSRDTARAAGIRTVVPDQCDYLLYVDTPLLSEDVRAYAKRIIAERRAESVYEIFSTSATNAELYRLR